MKWWPWRSSLGSFDSYSFESFKKENESQMAAEQERDHVIYPVGHYMPISRAGTNQEVEKNRLWAAVLLMRCLFKEGLLQVYWSALEVCNPFHHFSNGNHLLSNIWSWNNKTFGKCRASLIKAIQVCWTSGKENIVKLETAKQLKLFQIYPSLVKTRNDDKKWTSYKSHFLNSP